ncbi:MAG: hypothetical protein FWG98_01815 [Candidatus Cloacimonetes bacterium]|nr:hypothetical protein [Candidatus Cloacimonadota bacterium]
MILSIFIALIIAFLYYRKTLPEVSQKRKYILFFLRALVIYALLLLLFNPILYIRQAFTERPVFLVLIDKSNSMTQVIEGQTKSELLSRFDNEIRRTALNYNYAVEQIDLFVNNPRQSILLDEIRDILHSGKEIAGIALSSDGWFQDDQSLFREFINIPIYTFNPELENKNAELIINNITYNQNVAVNEVQPIRVSFVANNFEGTVQGILRHEGRVLQRRSIRIDGVQNNEINNDSDISLTNTLGIIDFEYSFSETGLKVFEIELNALDDDEVGDIGFAAVQVLDDKAKILILTDSFSWDIRVFNRYLGFGDRFDTDLVYLQNRTFRQHGNPITITWSDYAGFIILNHGNFTIRESDATTIKNMLLNGAGLIYVGNINAEFEDILPARISNIRITSEGQAQLNPVALSYQIFRDIEPHWGRFPPIQFHYFTAKEQAIVLAEIHDIQRIPVLFLGNYGVGNILHFAFNGLWRWQLNSEYGVFDRFINGLGQWIFSSSKDNFYAFTDKNIFYSGERITVKLSAFDERLVPLRNINARLDLFKSGSSESSSELVFSDFLVRSDDLFTINLPELDSGTYVYRIFDDLNNKEASGEFEVLEQDIQALSRGFNQRLLNALSQSSRGLNMTNNDLTDFNLERADSIRSYRFIEIPLYRNKLFIIVFLFAFCGELYLRKKWGLL